MIIQSAGKEAFKYLPLNVLTPARLFLQPVLAEVRESPELAFSEQPHMCTVVAVPQVCGMFGHVQGIGRKCQNHPLLVPDLGPWGSRIGQIDKRPT